MPTEWSVHRQIQFHYELPLLCVLFLTGGDITCLASGPAAVDENNPDLEWCATETGKPLVVVSPISTDTLRLRYSDVYRAYYSKFAKDHTMCVMEKSWGSHPETRWKHETPKPPLLGVWGKPQFWGSTSLTTEQVLPIVHIWYRAMKFKK